ncbi:CobW family GTP-binding protein [Variovorax sp. RA8]|uniref:CobW family GTP-binding protein n=1 Tax=Variovorax sp. (strain JCM 16519 / RA8) TaxID=662548 RepID=UPI000A4C905E|nr:GTP-binding protein [Variovorax sp. RA8]VTU38584.1 putative GTP-binding protein YjiA [Variovorax sp. RA8]
MTGHFSSLLGASQTGQVRVPVTVLTGFLGSGKTTLLNELLREPDLHGTAVIVNEFGEVGIDHDLIANTTEDTILLPNGCMCCAVRGDLIGALVGLAERGASGGSVLRHVLVETSGLADPAPILRTVMGEPAVKHRFTLAGVCCTVDAVLAPGTLDRYSEAARQVAMADHLFLTKADLLSEPISQELLDRLRGLNPTAAVHQERGKYVAALRQTMQTPATDARSLSSESGSFYRPVTTTGEAGDAPAHSAGITSFVITRDDPLPRDGFFAWLDMVIAMRGEDLLRVKGIVNLQEQPGQPLVFHGVQHLYQPPESLPAWPSADRRTRIVFITRGVDAESMDESLRVFERRRRPGPRAASSPDPSSKSTETP